MCGTPGTTSGPVTSDSTTAPRRISTPRVFAAARANASSRTGRREVVSVAYLGSGIGDRIGRAEDHVGVEFDRAHAAELVDDRWQVLLEGPSTARLQIVDLPELWNGPTFPMLPGVGRRVRHRCRVAFEHRHGRARTRELHCGGQTRRSASDDDHVRHVRAPAVLDCSCETLSEEHRASAESTPKPTSESGVVRDVSSRLATFNTRHGA